MSAAAINCSLSSATEETLGTGTRWLRRNRPMSPSTPPFSWAPSMPGFAEERVEPVMRSEQLELHSLFAASALQHSHHRRTKIVVTDPAVLAHHQNIRTLGHGHRGTLAGPRSNTRNETPCPMLTGASRTYALLPSRRSARTRGHRNRPQLQRPSGWVCGTFTSAITAGRSRFTEAT